MVRIACLVLSAALVGGCAFTPQAVNIAPTVSVKPSQVGVSGVGADISIDGDLVDSVQKALTDGLSRISFRPGAARGGSTAELRVEIRNVDYIINRGFWAGALRVDVGLKAICVRGTTRPYEKLHRGEFVESVQIVQTKESNAKYINTAVSSAVNDLLADQELVACLAQ